MLATRHISISLLVAHLNVYPGIGIEWGKKNCQHMLSVRGVLGVEVGLHAPLTSKLGGGV
jgi:hypothetical protein